jgi:Tetratricopeptide repeat
VAKVRGRGWWTSPRWIERSGEWARKKAAQRDGDKDPEQLLADKEALLATCIRIFGVDGGPTARGREGVAAALTSLGRHSEALALRKEVVSANERNLGDRHEYTLDSQLSYARSLHAVGDHSDAIDLCRNVLAVREEQLGVDHEDTKRTKRVLDRLVAET